jgi:hypothetical protein
MAGSEISGGQPLYLPFYWTSTRKELLHWLQRQAPPLAEMYSGAVGLLYGHPPVHGRSHFICHAVREIRNTLPHVIVGTRASPLSYKSRLDEITSEWRKLGPVDTSPEVTSTTQRPVERVDIPGRLFTMIDDLVRDHIEARQRPEQIARNLFVGLAPENRDFIDQIRPIVLHWLDVTGWFEKRVHRSMSTDEDLLGEEFSTRFEQFETILGSLVRRFFSTTDEIDTILAKANS